jgi:hypothetical protein
MLKGFFDISKRIFMKNKKIIIAGLALLALGVVSCPFYANASIDSSNDSNRNKSGQIKMRGGEKPDDRPEMTSTTSVEFEQKKAEREAKQEALNEALSSGDYNAWAEAVGGDDIMFDKITADNFSNLSEAYKLMKEAESLLEDAGLDGGMGILNGFGLDGRHGGFHDFKKLEAGQNSAE